MKKPTIKSAVIAIVLGGALYGLCANAHIDIFPCEITESQYQGSSGTDRIVTRSGTCSILGTNREPYRNDQGKITGNEELNTGGYIVCGIVFGLLPIGIGLFFGGSAAKEEDEAPAAPPADDGDASA